ncbi:MAG TPA: M2 family metallopeptidase [Vicinamibacteria bacterium]|nr:M2 family metallopeptidase [Vicinamibacteria bacterium]
MSATARRAAALASAAAFVLGAAKVAAQVNPPATAAGPAPTAAEARAFVEEAESRLLDLSNRLGRADWVAATYITTDTEKISAEANQALIAAVMDKAKAATRFDGLELAPDLRRKLNLLKLAAIPLPAPADPKLQAEITETLKWMEGVYGKGKYCRGGGDGDCLDVNEVTKIMAESRDEAELLDVWKGWRTISPPMRPRYARFVELANRGARDLGYKDLGAYWRSAYDMPADAFASEVDRLWGQVRPLYEALHAHVRASLAKAYPGKVPERGPIPAHLLGNIWAQQWGNIYPLVGVPATGPGYDLTELLKAKEADELEMVRYGERFFTSLGFEPLPKTFWDRSLFTKPRDREVVCHASAWDVDNDEDLRIKMCIEVNGEDFVTIHHELGHSFYQRAYNKQPFLFRNGANDGFHEAIGDTVALSVTPGYLQQVGLLPSAPGRAGDLEFLMRMALDKVAFLPFGLLVDQWRWKVFSGEVTPENYNRSWWELRQKYQGVAPPVPRTEQDFDPGAKYHVPANVPYTRYFLAHILQFQFHRAACREAGFTGPLHQCSIYANKEVGAKLDRMLEMGQSRPWPEALQAFTGERQIDATAIIDYFAPLRAWLDEQNRGRTIGWQ